MKELSKSQFKKAKRKERAKAERRALRKQDVVCLTCAEISNNLAWKIAGHKCPHCGADSSTPIDKKAMNEVKRLLRK